MTLKFSNNTMEYKMHSEFGKNVVCCRKCVHPEFGLLHLTSCQNLWSYTTSSDWVCSLQTWFNILVFFLLWYLHLHLLSVAYGLIRSRGVITWSHVQLPIDAFSTSNLQLSTVHWVTPKVAITSYLSYVLRFYHIVCSKHNLSSITYLQSQIIYLCFIILFSDWATNSWKQKQIKSKKQKTKSCRSLWSCRRRVCKQIFITFTK